MKLLNLIILLLCIGCSSSKKGANHKNNIDIDLVDFVTVKKELYASDSIYFLTKKEVKTLIDEWNESEYKGIYKMIPEYWIQIHLKNDSIRSFRTNKNLIKENSDWTYSLSNTNIIPTLWKDAEAIPPPPELVTECDSINQKAINDYKSGTREYITLGLMYTTDFEMFYFDFMKQHYNIIVKANCSPSTEEACYAEAMIYEIEKEYGEDFLLSTREKAKIEFIKSDK